MKPLPKLEPITETIRELHPDTKREVALVILRQSRELTPAEIVEFEAVCHRNSQRLAQTIASDLAHDQSTESHSFPVRASKHDD